MALANEAYETMATCGRAMAADIRGTANGDAKVARELFEKAAATPAAELGFLAFLLDEGEPAVKAHIHAVLRDMFLGDCEARLGEDE